MMFHVYLSQKKPTEEVILFLWTNIDIEDFEIDLSGEDIQTIPKGTWKKYIKKKSCLKSTYIHNWAKQ